MLQEDPSRMARLRENTARLRNGLDNLGLATTRATTPVVPLLLGDEWKAYRWARHLLDLGVFVSAVVYPAVSPGQARLRLCATAAHKPEHFERLFEGLAACQELDG
jgi:7-keto-8-aminopelargonate synthetase-like enzyme